MKLYTVDRRRLLQEDSYLKLTHTDPHLLPLWTLDGFFTQDDLNNHIQFLFPEGLSFHGWTYMKERHTQGVSPNYFHKTTFLTEMNFEYIRKAYYPRHPSRFQSIFGCATIEQAKLFRERFGISSNRIFEIECGQFLKVDMELLQLGVQNVSG